MNKIHIATATDKNYIHPLLGMMSSAIKWCPKARVIQFHIISDKLTDDDKSLVGDYAEHQGHGVNWIDYDASALDIPLTMHFTAAACLRLFFADIISENIDKIIYLDTDIILCPGGIAALDAVDPGDYSMAVVADVDVNYRLVKRRIGIDGTAHRYFNSGVLVINLKKWRKLDASKLHQNVLDEKRDSLFFVDQDILNLVWQNDVIYLPLSFNMYSAVFALPKKIIAKNGYTIQDVNTALSCPYVLHFYSYTYNRPWLDFCYHPLKQTYIDAMMDTPVGYAVKKTPLLKGVCFLFEHIFAYIPLVIKHRFINFLSLVKGGLFPPDRR